MQNLLQVIHFSRGRRLLLLLMVAVLLPAAIPKTAAAEISDTPVPLVNESGVERWSVGAGLAYWANNCFADEFNEHADLKRKPAAGGTTRQLEVINDFNLCDTYLNPVSTGDGLYYYDESQSRIERMPLSEPYEPEVVKELPSDQQPSFVRPIEAVGEYLYWVKGFPGKLLRVRMDGTGEVETIADELPFPTDLLVVGSTVYWADDDGIHSVSIDCDTLPCAGQTLYQEFGDNTRAHGLIYKATGGPLGAFRLYWVQHNPNGTPTYSIKYRGCNRFAICYLDPGDGLIDPPASFYATTPDRVIGELLHVNDNIFWTERDTPSGDNGELKRKVYNAGAGEAPDTIATGQDDIDDQLYVANGLLYFARRTAGIFTLALDATAITRDFSADEIEVTQGIQNLANSAPLVAKKTTYVRVYGRQLSGPNAPNVEARLEGTVGGSPLPGSPLTPVNGVRGLTTGGTFNRANLNDGWYFLLPANWTNAGQVELTFEVDPRLIHTDPARGNNELSVNVTFQEQPPVCVWTVPIRTHTPLPGVGDPNFWSMISHFNRRWPVPTTWIYEDTNADEELEVCWWGPFPHPCFGPYELEDGWGIGGIPDRDKVITSLWTRALLSFNPDACDDIGAPVHFMGLVHPTANNGGASGYASTVSNQSWVQLPNHTPNPVAPGWNMLREGSTMAQELAHNHGRKHVDCGNPDNVDNNYPYPPCQIADVGADSYYGFDVTTQQPIRPNQGTDFLTYAGNRWVSDYTWRSLMGKFAMSAVAGAAEPVNADQGESVFVSGLVDVENDRGEITSLLLLAADSLPPATRARAAAQVAGQATVAQQSDPQHADHPTAEEFKLRLLDAEGEVLVERTLTLYELDDHVGDSHAMLFTDLFPAPEGTVATVQLLADSTVIDERTPGVNPPTITIQQPTNGAVIAETLTVAWTADDPDEGDDLFFTIQYSHDNGASWHTIALNVPSTLPETEYSIAFEDIVSLHGSATNAARIRILATDGYNTSIATSPPFTLQNRPPAPAILTPPDEQTFPAGQSILLQGTATDAEDGGLTGDALAWQVDGIDFGTGADLTVPGLATGAHTAQLSATDANNQTASATVNFNVAPLSIPLGAAPSLDGVCTDAAYGAAVSLSLRPYADEGQATAQLLRSDDYLWVCFSGLKQGVVNPGAYVGLRADIDNSRPENAQAADAGFFVAEDGDVFTRQGDDAGDLVTPGPGGLQGQISGVGGIWSAELRIDRATLGDWNHVMNLSVGHHSVTEEDDDYAWPYRAGWAQPRTWAAAALGIQPVITALDPFSTTVLGPSFTLSVTGSGFVSGTQVLWDGSALATTFVDEGTLTAQVPSAQLDNVGVVAVSAQAPAPSSFVSNEASFVVHGLPPVIDTLSPAGTTAGTSSLTLVVNGSNFAPNAQVLWDGAPLTTQFVSGTELRVQLDPALIAEGQTVGVAVENPSTPVQISSATTFEITPEEDTSEIRRFLPALETP